jgi:hypothetical protein
MKKISQNKGMNKELSALGRAGGKRTLNKYGKKHFREMAQKRWDKKRKKSSK